VEKPEQFKLADDQAEAIMPAFDELVAILRSNIEPADFGLVTLIIAGVLFKQGLKACTKPEKALATINAELAAFGYRLLRTTRH
jgi:hypothetical protein